MVVAVLDRLVADNVASAPLAGKSVLVCTHATTATSKLIMAVTALGATVTYVPVSYSGEGVVDDIGDNSDVVVVEATPDAVHRNLPSTDIILDDGMRISSIVYDNPERYRWKEHLYTIEQTTSGIHGFERSMKSGLLYPVVNLAEAEIKREMENSVATPESILSLLVSRESLTLSRKRVLVMGYGSVGRGVSRLCASHGSVVTVAEEDPVRRAVAASHGYATVDVLDIDTALAHQDIVVSCTPNGNGHSLGLEQIMLMKDGALVVNAGTGTGEVTRDALAPGSYEKNRATITITKNGDGCVTCGFEKMGMRKTVRMVCSATPLNLGCGAGTTDDVMDVVFAAALATMIGVDGRQLSNSIHSVGADIEKRVATALLPPKYGLVPNHIAEGDLVREGRPWGCLFRFVPAEGAPALTRFSTARASFDPGSATEGHCHAVSEEAYLVESGSADILVWDPKDPKAEQKTYHVATGSYLSIPRGMAHRVLADPAEGFVCVIVASPPFSFWDQFFPNRPV